ncbi:MAG: J domain-containing protein [Candidatus Gottesmanbacteria bacterium]|nr:J domain-containing protein [Candidatus Gottesmanbacteria bacterium]
MNESQPRPIEMSDIASEIHKEILKNPYKYLGLSEDASIADIRSVYINKSRLYHPDMIDPRFDSGKLTARYNQTDFKKLEPQIAKDLHTTPTNLFKMVKKWLREYDPKDAEQRAKVLKAVQAAAHEKMIELNTAFEAIKSRYSRDHWNSPSGYSRHKYQNITEGFTDEDISLEAQHAELTIYPNAYESWVPGAYLRFDLGPIDDHWWYDDELRHTIVVKHLFIYKELQEGRTQISPRLLEQFFDNFRLDDSKQKIFLDLLVKRVNSPDIMQALGIEDENHFPMDTHRSDWYYSNRFRRHVNEMLTLRTEPDWKYKQITLQSEGTQLILEDYTQTILTEADVMLLSTLAYGPLLKHG